MNRLPVGLLVVIAALLGLSGCAGGAGGDTTCQQFAQLGGSTGLGASLTDEQDDVVTKMLRDGHRDTNQAALASLQVIAYCNIYDGRAGSNADEPISNIPGMR